MKKWPIVVLIAAIAVVAVLLAFTLPHLFGGDESSSSSLPSSSSSQASSLPAASSSVPAPSSSQSEPDAATLPAPAIDLGRPDGPYNPVDAATIGGMRGSWLYLYEDTQGDYHAYQYKFDEIEGYLMVGHGMMFSGMGSYYNGPYELSENGTITATVGKSDFEGDDAPTIRLTLQAELPPGSESVAFTLLSFENATPEFDEAFSLLLGQEMFYLPTETVSRWLESQQ